MVDHHKHQHHHHHHHQTVCSMRGDVGFPENLFRCSRCRNRFQHSYCGNYYGEFSEPINVCDWCQSEERNSSSSTSQHGLLITSPPSKKSNNEYHNNNNPMGGTSRSEYSGDKIKQQADGINNNEQGPADKGKSPTGTPSPRQRRYKLLKDVMC